MGGYISQSHRKTRDIFSSYFSQQFCIRLHGSILRPDSMLHKSTPWTCLRLAVTELAYVEPSHYKTEPKKIRNAMPQFISYCCWFSLGL